MRRGSLERAKSSVLGLLALVLLAGCRVDTHVAVTVNPDGSGVVAVTVVADADVVKQAPDLAQQLKLDDLTQAGWVVEGPSPAPDGGLTLVLRHEFADVATGNAVLQQLAGPNGPLSSLAIAATGHPGDVEWTFDGRLDFSKGLDAFADEDLLAKVGATPWLDTVTATGANPADAASVSVEVALPGTPATTGDTTASTAPAGAALGGRWSARAGDAPVTMSWRTTATSSEVRHARRVERRFLLYLVLYLVFVAGLVVLWFWLRARRRRPTAA